MKKINYRIKQFLWCFNIKITREEEELIKKYLNENEIEIFNKLSISDKKHSLRVVKNMLYEYSNMNIKCPKYLIKAGFFHDIGKCICYLNPIEKGILVILNKITKGNIKKINNKKIYLYYNHGEIGYNILKELGFSNEILELVKYHHKDCINSLEMKVLKNSDNKS